MIRRLPAVRALLARIFARLLPPRIDRYELTRNFHKMGVRSLPIVVVTAKDVTAEDRQRLNGDVVGLIQRRGLDQDALLAGRILDAIGVPAIHSELIAEGGGLCVDGEGTLLTTDTCFPNKNRNPDWSRDQIEDELKLRLGVGVDLRGAQLAAVDPHLVDQTVEVGIRFELFDEVLFGSPERTPVHAA